MNETSILQCTSRTGTYVEAGLDIDKGHLITYVADSIGCVQIAVPPQVLLHGDGGCPVVLGRHDGLVAHYAGRGILAHGGGRMGEEEENELNELAGWKLENS